MLTSGLHGVIAAIPTPVAPDGTPDAARLVARAAHQLANGCDGLNLLGTTGEATSFSLAERFSVMRAVAQAGLPLDRFMVGTGAAATRDAQELTSAAADLGFAGALVLPPFYYKGISDDGIARYIDRITSATSAQPIPIYLYNFPALSGVLYSLKTISLLLSRFGNRIAGLKDSSGDMAYAEGAAALSPELRVFPSNEGVLLRARSGEFAGCISATANLNSTHCAAAYYQGDARALEIASAVRGLFAGLPLVPGIKAILGRITGDAAWMDMAPPLTQLSQAELATLWERVDALPLGTWRD